ncbi:hypothetical protein [Pseudomonas phage JB10]|uniref:Uncharacterized protein n=1 Tax=Pseudomonas phage JB10 TaxID=3028140 RepID=A0AAF0CZ92_9CAUD|nr:hypothetical protein [Pseudomonas phage JB10]
MRIFTTWGTVLAADMLCHFHVEGVHLPVFMGGSVFRNGDGTYRICAFAESLDRVDFDRSYSAVGIASAGAARRKVKRIMRRLYRELQQTPGVKV